MFAVDAAEAQGDAVLALAMMEETPCGPDGRPWWRPERLRRLRQIITLGDDCPRWVVQRWLVAQAAQSSPGRPQEAIEIAIRTRGGRSTLWGVDPDDAMAKVLDHDWVYRQLVLHEHGGLADFVHTRAMAGLLSRAGDMTPWLGVPMRGLELVHETSDRIVWRDLATDDVVETLNLGGASMLAIGEAVLGRVVPSDGVHLFDIAPLCVPIDVAREVAAEPSAWLSALERATRSEHGALLTDLIARAHHFDLLFDLGAKLRRHLVEPADPDLRSDKVGSGGNGVDYDVALVLAALSGELDHTEDLGCDCGECSEIRPLGALVAAAVLEPETAEALAPLLVSSDGAALLTLERSLVAPADVLCRRLRLGLADAA